MFFLSSGFGVEHSANGSTEIQDSFVTCGPLVYSKPDPLQLIEWLEFQQLLNSSRVVMHVSINVDPIIRRILAFYEATGLVTSHHLLMTHY